MRPTLPRALFVLPLALAALPATPGIAQVPSPLPIEQVHCQADRLMALLDRTDLWVGPEHGSIRQGARPIKPVAILWTLGSPDGDPAGLALSEQGDLCDAFGTEKQLWVAIDPNVSPLARDPAAPRPAALGLARNPLSTDLRLAGDAETLAVAIGAATTQPRPPLGSFLWVENARAGKGADAKRDPALSAALAPCGEPLSRVDLHVLRVLARVLRTLSFGAFGSGAEFAEAAQFAILYRGAASAPIPGGARTSYRLDAVSYNYQARLSAEIEISLAADGTMGRATLRLLPPCAHPSDRDCSRIGDNDITLQAIPPVAAGVCRPTVNPTLCLHPDEHFACGPAEVSFDFTDLLAGTTWQRP